MKPKHLITRLVLLFAATLACTGSARALELYDTFKGIRAQGIPGRLIDPDLWDPWNSHSAQEMTRALSGGKVILKSITHGGEGSDSGRRSGRSSLAFPESVGADITEIQATVQTTKLALTDCPANGDNGRVLTPRIGGQWFSDGTVPADDEDLTGSVFAAIDVRRLNSHDAITDRKDPMYRKNRLQVVAQVYHCGSHDCDDGATIGFETLGIMTVGQKRRMRIQWDKAGKQFLFQFHRNEPLAISYDGVVTVVGPVTDAADPPRFWKRIEHRGQPENCQEGQTTILGETRVFDVHLNDEAVND